MDGFFGRKSYWILSFPALSLGYFSSGRFKQCRLGSLLSCGNRHVLPSKEASFLFCCCLHGNHWGGGGGYLASGSLVSWVITTTNINQSGSGGWIFFPLIFFSCNFSFFKFRSLTHLISHFQSIFFYFLSSSSSIMYVMRCVLPTLSVSGEGIMGYGLIWGLYKLVLYACMHVLYIRMHVWYDMISLAS